MMQSLNKGERQVLQLSDSGWKAPQISRSTGLTLLAVQRTISRYHTSLHADDRDNARIARGSDMLRELVRAAGGHR